ncbi:MAG: dienelactone hydrolase family protein [Kiritimatiellae bacterium]|nr:dienelactone hydrolase family protein [Kiritimatiellia bacterium]
MKYFIYLFFMLFSFARAEFVVESVAYSLGEDSFEGALVYPGDAAESGEKLPGILMVPNWMGVGDRAIEKAERIAGMGFAVFVADMYGADIRPENTDEAGQAAGFVKSDRALMRARAVKAVEVFHGLADDHPVHPEQTLAIGFCFGGTTVLELARGGTTAVQGVVSFHGNLDTPDPEDGKQIRVPVLVLHGADDPIVPDSEVAAFVAEMRAAETDWQLVSFGGAVHSFTDPHAAMEGVAEYEPKTAARAFEMMRDFAREVFGED